MSHYGMYIGAMGPVYEIQDGTSVNITSSNITTYFSRTNGSYYFSGSGSVFTSNNSGIKSSTAKTTLVAKQDMKISFDYSYSSEANYDKFTLTVANVVIEKAVSGATTSKSYSGNILKDQSIIFEYTKDVSVDSNNDKCTFSNMIITPQVQVQIGEASTARQVQNAYVGVNGINRKIGAGYAGIDGVSRAIFIPPVTWKKYDAVKKYTYSVDEEYIPGSGFSDSFNTYLRGYSSYYLDPDNGYVLSGTVSSIATSTVTSTSQITAVIQGKYTTTSTHYDSTNDRYISYLFKGRSGITSTKSDGSISYGMRSDYNRRSYGEFTGYKKGTTSYGTLTVENEALPETGTLIQGSAQSSSCVLNVNGTYYYYEKE